MRPFFNSCRFMLYGIGEISDTGAADASEKWKQETTKNPLKHTSMENYTELALRNQRRAHEIIARTELFESWHSIGGMVNNVGSLSTGLLMKHLDIDLHIYTDRLSIEQSFAAAAKIAAHDGITHMEYTNLIDTEEKCIEWHAMYRDEDGMVWQIDMIHILRGSAYDGFAERMAARIKEVLTPETRDAILRLKYETPDGYKIMGAQYYAAVLSGGVRTFAELESWMNEHSHDDLIHWLP